MSRARTADVGLPRRVPRHRAGRRRQPPEDGEALRAGGRASSPTSQPTPPNSSQALAACCARRWPRTPSADAPAKKRSGARWRDDVRQAQASWNRLGPVPGEAGRQLTDRFHRAVQPLLRSVPAPRAAAANRRPAARAKAVGSTVKAETTANMRRPHLLIHEPSRPRSCRSPARSESRPPESS